ncbi:MAG: Phosphoesterase, RecJ domain protein, partial [uncultured Gemmatimonadetes bacterium]
VRTRARRRAHDGEALAPGRERRARDRAGAPPCRAARRAARGGAPGLSRPRRHLGRAGVPRGGALLQHRRGRDVRRADQPPGEPGAGQPARPPPGALRGGDGAGGVRRRGVRGQPGEHHAPHGAPGRRRGAHAGRDRPPRPAGRAGSHLLGRAAGGRGGHADRRVPAERRAADDGPGERRPRAPRHRADARAAQRDGRLRPRPPARVPRRRLPERLHGLGPAGARAVRAEVARHAAHHRKGAAPARGEERLLRGRRRLPAHRRPRRHPPGRRLPADRGKRPHRNRLRDAGRRRRPRGDLGQPAHQQDDAGRGPLPQGLPGQRPARPPLRRGPRPRRRLRDRRRLPHRRRRRRRRAQAPEVDAVRPPHPPQDLRSRGRRRPGRAVRGHGGRGAV